MEATAVFNETMCPIQKRLEATAAALGVDEGLIYVKGRRLENLPDADTVIPFVQDSNLVYLTGITRPGFELGYDIKTKKSVLLVPFVSAEEAMWDGPSPTIAEYKEHYKVTDIEYVEQGRTMLVSMEPSVVYMLEYQETDLFDQSKVDRKQLMQVIHESRTVKDEYEIAIMKRANEISSKAHRTLMAETRLGDNECSVYGRFAGEIRSQGCDTEAYSSIVAGGRNASVLHYIQNNEPLSDGDALVLIDAGGKYHGYTSDITRTWPVGKTFSKKAKDIYELVLKMQLAAIDAVQPGAKFEEINVLVNEIATRGLHELGILVGDVQALLESHVVGYFMPHGLGHFLGIDTHDVAGYPAGVGRIDAPGLRNLRLRRTLQPGNVVTIEPGLYFVDALLDQVRENADLAPLVDFAAVAEYRSVGGVRIEDNLVLTANGHINLTSVPKSVADIETIRATA